MKRRTFSPAFNSKLVLALLQGEKELGALVAEHNLNPNIIRNLRITFIKSAGK